MGRKKIQWERKWKNESGPKRKRGRRGRDKEREREEKVKER